MPQATASRTRKPIEQPSAAPPAAPHGDILAGPMSGGPTPADVAARAYALYLERGGDDGRDLDDWLQAERELRGDEGARSSGK